MKATNLKRRLAPGDQVTNTARDPVALPLSARARLFRVLRATGWGVLLALGLLALVWQIIGVSNGPTDFCQDYIAAQRFVQGLPIYSPLRCWTGHLYVPAPVEYDAHPPTSVLVLTPLVLLPQTLATLVWGLGSLTAYLAAGILLLRELGWRSLGALALFVWGSLFWQPATLAESVQNFPQILLFLLVGAWLLERRQHAGWAGGLIGVAGLLKIWPAALLLLAIFQRRWLMALVGGLVIVGGTLLSLALMGPATYAAYLGSVQTNEHYWVPGEGSFSLVSAVARPFTGYADPTFPLPPVAHVLSLGDAVFLGELVAGLFLLGTLGFIAWCNRGERHEAVYLLNQSLLITVLLLVFPLNLYWGLIILLLPGALLLLALRRLPRPSSWWFVLLGISLVPCLEPAWVFDFSNWLLESDARLHGLATIFVGLPTASLLFFAGLQASLLWRAVALYPGEKRNQ